jgi:hypothetical protein
MTKKLQLKKIVISLILLLILIIPISIVLYKSYEPFNKVPNLIKEIKGKEQNGNFVWDDLTDGGYKQVICKKDFFNPEVVTLIPLYNQKDNGVFGFYTSLNRKNIFDDFKTDDYKASSGSSTFSKLSFDEVAKLYEKNGCDYYKKNTTIDGINISYNPPLTPEEIKKNEEASLIRLDNKKKLEEQQAKALSTRLESSIKGLPSLEERLELLKQGITEYNGKPIDPPYVDQFKVRVDARKLAIKTMKKILANEELTPEEKQFADDNGYFNNVQ